ncbi:ABC transporter permease, partial [Candidatus Woesebacteria bacterium]|nr:ABC transporter permease [Candidatus Woesebacteria bacterium]
MINMTNIAHQKEKALLLIKEYISTAKSAFFTADMGMLSWYYLLKLASKNLLRSFSRTSITIGAIASGTAAIVFLVGFAYGLQTIVSDRLIQPNSLRLADVQSNSTALQLDTENLEKIRNISGVVAVAPAISMAGTLKFNDSKTEVIIVASRNAYMEYSNVSLVAGTFFSAETEAEYTGTTNDITGLFTEVVGQVAGVSTTSAQIKTGDRILDEKELNLRIQDGSYVPLRSSPEISSPILGYIKGSILDMYAGTTYWGDAYNSSGVQGRAYQDELGNWFGKWILIDSALVYQETVPTVYVPVVDESGNQAPLKGYISFENVAVLSNDETNSQKMLDSLLEDQGIVLGETTDSEVASDSSVVVVSYGEESVASDEAALLNSILDTNEPVTSEQSVTSAIVSIPRTEGKEVIISTGLLNIWELQPEDVMNKTISLGYILGGGIIPGLNGKVSTEELEYTVIGVAQQDDKPIVFAPLSDLESIGVA